MATWQTRAQDLVKTLGLKLSREQDEAFLLDSRIKVVTGGEGSSKSFMASLTGLARALSDAADMGFAKPHLIWCVGADYEDARKDVDYLFGPEFAWLDELGILDREHSSIPTLKDQKVILHTTVGITFETVTGYDPTKIGREQPDGILGAEIGRWEKEVWDRCYGRLMRKYPRAWGYFSGSFETSEGWMVETFALGQGPNELDIRSISLPTWANRAIYPGGYDDPAIQMLRAQTTEARFLERFAGKPSPPKDAVFPEFKHLLHVTENAEFEEMYPTLLFVDPGDHVYSVLFVQFKEDEVHVVDELYVQHWSHEQVVQGCQLKPSWAGAGTKGHVIDIAGSQHHMGMSSAVESWYNDTGISFAFQKRSVDDQLDKLRSVLALNPTTGRPRLQVHPRCPGLISEMGGGPSPIEGVGRWRVKAGKPSEKNNHSSKALAYGLLENYGAVNVRGPVTPQSYLGPSVAPGRPTSYLERALLHEARRPQPTITG